MKYATNPVTAHSGRIEPRRAPLARSDLAFLVGYAAIAFSALYFASDLIEAVQGGFSTTQLALTLVAEAAVPFLAIGLYAAQAPRMGRLGFAAALAYAYSYVFFTGSVIYALLDSTPDFEALGDDLGVWMTLHGGIMLLGGVAFGVSVLRARVLPAWNGVMLIAGVVLVVATAGQAQAAVTAAAGVRAAAFAAMGATLLAQRGANSTE